ncbi:hypothetical protein HRR83_007969 [Exophiala dermatitidis]|uniref:Uncharacterized protein n=1 Tax=Exophiala dermatitidis TaxID=5970 RepID=A0AAN6ITU8_EXODE|nr:hypothetical protein HRR77_007771 [Exophiala dermatitidis]KAJ4541929.1 hypothetical protein HRR78_007207 [Exophiala dermatitidis]KAJ4544691.1 hypothetical protein HRR76_002739 [Exophiala dermatitidis]KAJ4554651.1 hypothetical protein HRR79_009503 [Exophiala dermatitidis]KAJ4569973.1 hypothetical protein HRR82_007543 [Exophiala dermatitidis]
MRRSFITTLSSGPVRRGMSTRALSSQQIVCNTRVQRRSLAAVSSGNPEQKVQSTQNAEDKRAAQQNRHNIDRQSDEVSKSGTDDAVAAQASVAFDKSGASIDEIRERSGQQNAWGNPLDASPANRSISEGTDEARGGIKAKQFTPDKTVSRSDSRLKGAEPGFEKKAFAGSTKKEQDDERGPMIRPGSR